jgi:hypothetical protein
MMFKVPLDNPADNNVRSPKLSTVSAAFCLVAGALDRPNQLLMAVNIVNLQFER